MKRVDVNSHEKGAAGVGPNLFKGERLIFSRGCFFRGRFFCSVFLSVFPHFFPHLSSFNSFLVSLGRWVSSVRFILCVCFILCVLFSVCGFSDSVVVLIRAHALRSWRLMHV